MFCTCTTSGHLNYFYLSWRRKKDYFIIYFKITKIKKIFPAGSNLEIVLQLVISKFMPWRIYKGDVLRNIGELCPVCAIYLVCCSSVLISLYVLDGLYFKHNIIQCNLFGVFSLKNVEKRVLRLSVSNCYIFTNWDWW